MGDSSIEYRVGALGRFRVPVTLVFAGPGFFVMVVALGTVQGRFEEWFLGLALLVTTPLAFAAWVKANHPLSVTLSSSGVELVFTHKMRIYTPWHDIAAVEINTTASRA